MHKTGVLESLAIEQMLRAGYNRACVARRFRVHVCTVYRIAKRINHNGKVGRPKVTDKGS